MSPRLEIVILLHLLVEKKILTVVEAKHIATVTQLRRALETRGVIVDFDLYRVKAYYSKMTNLVGKYLAGSEAERLQVINELVTLMGGADASKSKKDSGGN